MKDGQKAAGAATLLSALRETNDPGLLNDIAFELADADHVTREVEDASRKSVEQLDCRIRKLDPHHSGSGYPRDAHPFESSRCQLEYARLDHL